MDELRIPSKQQQSWGALLSIVIIMMMVVGGAYYAWNKRAADERALQDLTKGLGGTENNTSATTTATVTP